MCYPDHLILVMFLKGKVFKLLNFISFGKKIVIREINFTNEQIQN